MDYINQQVNIIKTLAYYPNISVDYIHHPGMINNLPGPYIKEQCLFNDNDLIPLGKAGKVGVPYLVRNTNLILKISKLDDVFSKFLLKAPVSLEKTSKRKVRACISKVNLNRIRYIASDEFTNETLIAYILNVVAWQRTLPPLFVIHYQGNICNGQGQNLMEYCDLGSLDDFQITDPNHLRLILEQIVIGIYMLQKHVGFVSGDLKAGNIFIKSEPIDFIFEGRRITAPFTCKIADYGKSSCMILCPNDLYLRFYNESSLANLYLTFDSFDPNIIKQEGYYYTITDLFNVQVSAKSRHMGLPYYKSFDLYTIMVSILTHRKYYEIFFADQNLINTFWNPLWDDSEIVRDRLQVYLQSGKGRSINDAIDIIRNLPLKCNVVDKIYNLL